MHTPVDSGSRWDACAAALTTSTASLTGKTEDLGPNRAARADSSGNEQHSEKTSTGVKHIDRRVLGVKQQFADGNHYLDRVPTEANAADLFATNMSCKEFEFLRTMTMGPAFPRYRDTEEPSHWSKNAKATSSPANPAGQEE